jgi:hemerythrin-like domain-containing protein
MDFKIPDPLKAEHKELHAELRAAIDSGGAVRDAAKAVAELLHPHFVKEEAYALPPLGVLVLLAKGEVRPEMAEVVAMTDKLRSELPNMLAEHACIVEALRSLGDAAERENNRQVAQFAEKLKLHAQTEEQVLYPAAIVLGDYLRLKLNK